jgi:hypothetical protein
MKLIQDSIVNMIEKILKEIKERNKLVKNIF